MNRKIIIKEYHFMNIINKLIFEQELTPYEKKEEIINRIYDIIDNISISISNYDYSTALIHVNELHRNITNLSQYTKNFHKMLKIRNFCVNLENDISNKDIDNINKQINNILDLLPIFSR